MYRHKHISYLNIRLQLFQTYQTLLDFLVPLLLELCHLHNHRIHQILFLLLKMLGRSHQSRNKDHICLVVLDLYPSEPIQLLRCFHLHQHNQYLRAPGL